MAIFGGAHLASDSARGSSGPGAVGIFSSFFRATILGVWFAFCWCIYLFLLLYMFFRGEDNSRV